MNGGIAADRGLDALPKSDQQSGPNARQILLTLVSVRLAFNPVINSATSPDSPTRLKDVGLRLSRVTKSTGTVAAQWLILLFSVFGTLILTPLRTNAGTLTTALPYTGTLQTLGVPANGPYDFTFRLFDDAQLGRAASGVVTNANVDVKDGTFTVTVDFGLEAFDGSALWLEIGVRQSDEINGFTLLTPRQRLAAVPFALYAFKSTTYTNSNEKLNASGGVATNLVLTGNSIVQLQGGDAQMQIDANRNATITTSNLLEERFAIPVEASFATGTHLWIPSAGAYGYAATYRKRLHATVGASFLRFYYAGATATHGHLAGMQTVYKVAFQFADSAGNPTGDAIPVTFNGSPTANVAALGYVASDPIPVSLNARDDFFAITYVSNTNLHGLNSYLGINSGDNFYAGDASGDPGLFVNDTSQSGANSVCPGMVTGLVRPSDRTGVVAVGDSIIAESNSGYDSLGWIGFALHDSRGLVNIGIGSSRLTSFTNQASFNLALVPVRFCRDAVVCYGFNDLFTAGISADSCEVATVRLMNQLKNAGIRKRILCTVKPATFSADGWTTEINQTLRPGDLERLVFNNWLLKQSNSICEGVFDFASTLASATNASIEAVGPGTVLLSDTAGALTSTNVVRTSDATVGSQQLEGGVLVLNHDGTNYYTEIRGVRPGNPQYLELAFPLGAAAPGDSYQVLEDWVSDSIGDGAHPSGYGHAHAGSLFDLELLK